MKIVVVSALVVFNLIIIAGPAAGILGAYLGLWAAVAGLVLGAGAGVVSLFLGEYESASQILYMCMMAGGLGILLGCFMVYLGRYLYHAGAKYVQWQARVVKGADEW